MRRRLRSRIGADAATRERAGSAAHPAGIQRVLGSIGVAARRIAAMPNLDDATLGGRVLVAAAGASVGARLVPGGRALVGAAAGGWGALRLIDVIEARRARADEAGVARELPFVLERMATAFRTGRGIDGAIALVATGVPGPLGFALRDAARLAELGAPRSEVLARLERAPGDVVHRVTRTLARSERRGVPVADAVEELAAELRARARAAAETEARTAPVRMLFPPAFCFLPAFVVLTIVPIAIDAMRSLGGL